ncbi:MAG: hypothetical protein FD120_2792, partial [Gammaproteobacteria bacterium]
IYRYENLTLIKLDQYMYFIIGKVDKSVMAIFLITRSTDIFYPNY